MNTLDHIGIYVADLETSLAFYKNLFGFNEAGRLRDGDIDMVFLDMGGGLLQLKQTPRRGQPGSGKWIHFAIYVADYPATLEKLQAQSIPYWEAQIPGGSLVANFSDPDGHDLEVCAVPLKEVLHQARNGEKGQ